MKPILTVLALILTSTLFAQQKPERAPRDPRVPGAERQDPLPRDARAQQFRERLRAMREARSRQDGDERQEQGPRTRPGAGRGEAGRGPGRHGRPGHGPRHHGNGGRRPEGVRRNGDDAPRDSARGLRGGLPVQRMAQMRERFQQMRERFQQVRAERLQRAQPRVRALGGRDI